jgi:hypothetical protein
MRRHIERLENIHVPLWLLKDACWMMHLVIPALVIMVPTILLAARIVWKSRIYRDLLFQNSAILCWICANSLWMLGEFFDFEITLVALGFFISGLLTVGYFYGQKYFSK